jgi:branched-chain amino acid transport system ATP-binding protein
MQVSDRVVVLDFGRKIAEGSPAEIQRNPEVIRAYLGDELEVGRR